MSSESLSTSPKNVTHLGTIFATFRYPAGMSIGERLKITQVFITDKGHAVSEKFVFELEKTSQNTVSIVCRRVFKEDIEPDDGCFLRLYISVIGVNEKPKSAVLRSTETFTSVEFVESSFLSPKVHVNYDYTLKCAIRRIETTLLSNELRRDQEDHLKYVVLETCKTSKQREDMAYVLKLPDLQGYITGRNPGDYYKTGIVSRACSYSKKLEKYFRAKRESESNHPNIDLSKVIGYICAKKKEAIENPLCIKFHFIASRLGLLFLKELIADYLIENLNDELVVEMLKVADLTEDERLFSAVLRYSIRKIQKIVRSHEWKMLATQRRNTARSIIHRILLLVFFIDGQVFPPAMEEETGEV